MGVAIDPGRTAGVDGDVVQALLGVVDRLQAIDQRTALQGHRRTIGVYPRVGPRKPHRERQVEEHFVAARNHSASLFPALEKARALVEHVDLVAVGLGPGSYAGVRIAIAAALGLEWSLGARLVGLPSVAALEVAAREFVVIGDARRETFYFTRVAEGGCVEGPLLATAQELAARLAECGALPLYAAAEVPGFPAAEIVLPSAVLLARFAAHGRGLVTTGDLEPIYLREPHITRPRSDIPRLP